MGEETKRNLLKRAGQILGREELARRLKIPVSMLDAWTNGLATMPARKLVQLADILEDIDNRK